MKASSLLSSRVGVVAMDPPWRLVTSTRCGAPVTRPSKRRQSDRAAQRRGRRAVARGVDGGHADRVAAVAQRVLEPEPDLAGDDGAPKDDRLVVGAFDA